MGNKVSLEDEMVNLRIVSKQMQRSSKKCEKNEKAALQKLKKVSRFVFTFGFLVDLHTGWSRCKSNSFFDSIGYSTR